jgi:hypothetical protein
VRIFVAGGFDHEDQAQAERARAFATALGEAVAEHGHVLLNGCRTELDCILARATCAKLTELGETDPDKRVVSYVISGLVPAHDLGTILRSRLTDWDLNKETFYIPEPVQQADVVVLVGGFDGTFRAANWARIAQKPLLPFAGLGGASERIYQQELNEFATKYGARVDQLEYEQLNSLKPDWSEHATDIVALAEKIGESRRVLVIMSYGEEPDLIDAYESFKQVTGELGFECDRVTEENAGKRILPDILERIEQAAFTIVDLTDLRPNVFYELGYADGLGKRVVATAREGTELPFDVKDIPVVYWQGQTQLKQDLRTRIVNVVKPAIAEVVAP